MVQTAGSMGGNVSGIDSYSRSAGVIAVVSDGFMDGKVTTATYSLSGGGLQLVRPFWLRQCPAIAACARRPRHFARHRHCGNERGLRLRVTVNVSGC